MSKRHGHRGRGGSSAEHARAHKGALGLHKKHPAGHQTSAQLRAERANLILARAARGQMRAQARANLGSVNEAGAAAAELATLASLTPVKKPYVYYANTRKPSSNYRLKPFTTTGYKRNPKIRTTGYKRNYRIQTEPGFTPSRALNPFTRHPYGSHMLVVNLARQPSHRNPTGTFLKFRKRLAPGGYMRVSTWGASRRHHYHKRLSIRKPHVERVKKWRKTRKRIRPR